MPSTSGSEIPPTSKPLSPGPGSVSVRAATVADAEALLEIYNPEVLESLVTFDLVPRSLQDQRDYIQKRSGAFLIVVAEADFESGRKVVGFASLSPYRDRPGYRTSVENSVYVHRDHYQKGVGSLLLRAVIERARAHGFHAIFARIAGSQRASMTLHERHGFFLVGVEREVGRKFNQWLDVATMELLL